MSTVELIWKHVPKWMKVVVATVVLSPIAGYIVVQIAAGKEIVLSTIKIIFIGGAIVAYGIICFIVGAWRFISHSPGQPEIQNDNIRELPTSYVTIGNITDGVLSVGIRAQIILLENSQPDIDSFLDRIYIGDPFCSNCSNPLNKKHGSWMIDGVHIGYTCYDCQTEYEGDYAKVKKKARGEVRRKYETYWSKYQKEINSLTGGHPEKYRVPY